MPTRSTSHTPRSEAHEHAVGRAIELLHQAEDSADYRERDTLRGLAAVYVNLARELRLGQTKSGVYQSTSLARPDPPAASLDPASFPKEEEDSREMEPV